MINRRLVLLAALVWGFVTTTALQAEMLTISRGDTTVVLTEEEFLALPQTEYTTINDYVSAPTLFSGVLLRDLVALVGTPQPGDLYRGIALNDYAADLPIDDALAFDVLVARSRDGVPMSIRNKGPLWVVYPTEVLPQSTLFSVNNKLIWQLKALEYVAPGE